jgi:hypothetical protein
MDSASASRPSRDILVRRAATSTFGAAAFGAYTVSSTGHRHRVGDCDRLGLLMDARRFSQVPGASPLQALAIGAALRVARDEDRSTHLS